MLLALAQGVANATAALVLKAKNIASQSPDTKAQSKMITAAKETARTTSQLVACVKVVVPSITSHMCQEQVVEAAKLVATAVDDTESACKVSEFASVTNIYLLLTLSIVDQKKRLLELIKWSPKGKFFGLLSKSLVYFSKEMFGDQSVLVIFAGIAQELYGSSTHHCKQAFWLLSLIPKGINNNQHFLDTTLLF